ncbi:larval/pupal cuticle protein H1C-like [Maniola hyperantus]|uniref:larval/pupal cuticle protein H1C-like n=1 Tax=Aphantopus hyperantus TaxID=2795564 RepID=UPI001568563A|nr:larval/pupal cuticle protein H1C-like [Maniola hyperantus]
MYKLVVFAALVAYASAGLIASPWGNAGGWGNVGGWGNAGGWGHGLVGAPVVSAPIVSAPIVKQAVPVATSYANTVRIATPAVAVAPAPYAIAAHGPVVAPLGHGW